MNKGVVAIVGATNVGKSTLFNRITLDNLAIVDKLDGVTRDKNYRHVDIGKSFFSLIDTGGFSKEKEFSFGEFVNQQVIDAIDEAELILFVVDSKLGITSADDRVVKILKKSRKKVIVIANKADTPLDEFQAYSFMKLGFGDPFPISALYKKGVRELVQLIKKRVTLRKKGKNTEIKIAIVGRPNVGKSSIINKLSVKNVSIVSSISGTTRDTIPSFLNYKNRRLLFLDTAGIRRKSRTKFGVDYFSTKRALSTIKDSHMILLILDATQPFSNQDQKIAAITKKWHKGILIVVNKWDLIKKEDKTSENYKREIYKFFPFLKKVPVLFTSALTGQRIHNILEATIRITDKNRKRVPTSVLNRFINRQTSIYSPTNKLGRIVKIKYITQISNDPPQFVCFCNRPELINKQYITFLENRIKKEFDLGASFIKVSLKKGD